MSTVSGWHAVREGGGLKNWGDEISVNGEDGEKPLSKLSPTCS